jgi:predicted DNA-binding transcriptional regulator AlpA
MTIRALSVAEIAERADVSLEAVRSLARRGALPPPDVEIGVSTGRPVRGWTAETVDEWLKTRRTRPLSR